ncbi:hypothetical protein CBR_g30332 [Chara braunii]|uniref:DNA polymerase III subunit delta n=1 Tax=Chara braunii TaxID=69332 RepID=A0A388JX79_CHABU|nr:hypothetical protein CBR_g30332 [Chara braunii]|eukprot:GBG62378.1 hypothetical protein CBR_g30332 [Chara braunii]
MAALGLRADTLYLSKSMLRSSAAMHAVMEHISAPISRDIVLPKSYYGTKSRRRSECGESKHIFEPRIGGCHWPSVSVGMRGMKEPILPKLSRCDMWVEHCRKFQSSHEGNFKHLKVGRSGCQPSRAGMLVSVRPGLLTKRLMQRAQRLSQLYLVTPARSTPRTNAADTFSLSSSPGSCQVLQPQPFRLHSFSPRHSRTPQLHVRRRSACAIPSPRPGVIPTFGPVRVARRKKEPAPTAEGVERLDAIDKPVHIFYGGDMVAMESAVKAAISAVVGEGSVELNFLRLQEVDDHGAVLSAIQTLMTAPLIGGKGRAVWLVEPKIMSKRCPSWLEVHLQDLVRMLPRTSRLVITLSAAPNTSWRKALVYPELANAEEFVEPNTWNKKKLTEQVHKAAARDGLKLSPKAAEIVAEFAAGNTLTVDRELKKLSLLATEASGGFVDADMVTGLVPVGVGCLRAVQLADRIREGDVREALKGLELLLASGKEEPVGILLAVVGQFREWLVVKAGMAAGKTDVQIAKALGLRNPKRLFFLKADAKHLPLDVLKECLQLCFETEVVLKTGAGLTGYALAGFSPIGSQFGIVSDSSPASASRVAASQLIQGMMISMCEICRSGNIGNSI